MWFEDESVFMTNQSLDACLDLVSDGRRRRVIQHLRHETDGTTTVEDLVDRIHHGGSASDDRIRDRERLAIQLHHAHLPKLQDHGVVEYDPGNGAVRYQPSDQLEEVLDSLSEELSLPSP